MNRKIASLLLGCAMLTSVFTGCNNPAAPSPSPGTDNGNAGTPKETTLTLWTIATESDAFRKPYEKAIAEFEKANPGVKIVHEAYENESYKQKIKTAVSGNNLPDIFFTWGGGFSQPFLESGKVLPIDKYYENYKNDLSTAALSNVTYDGKIYGTTYTTAISSMFYNKKIFDENGVTAPKTYDELVSVCKTLKGKGITPIGISAKDTWVIAMTHDAMTLKSAGSKKVVDALQKKGQSYDDPDFLNSATKLKELVDMGAFHEGAAGLTNDEASALLYSGKVAMYTTGSWMAGSIMTDAPNPEDFDVIPFPVLNDANAKLTDFMGGPVDSLMVNASTKNPDMAAKAAFEITKLVSKEAYLAGAGLPVWKKDYDDSTVKPMTKKLADFASSATSFTLWFDTLLLAEDAGVYLSSLQQLFVGDIKPDEFVKTMKDQLSK